ncbi:synaptotagmin-11 isoform X1 [Ischnura elegans]|uniref:synaptotagmin-11 isoform X1 n=1 Tax=Ischnura elegans TaxID=197161 RepID=UPI001ED8B169|nr:synaptotagmin-11 isoform X1 [Ischnura elegans]
MVSHTGDGPEIKAIESVTTPALVGILLGTTLFLVTVAAVTCLCYRRRHSLVLLPLHGGVAQPFGRRRASAQPNSATASLFGPQGSLRKGGCGGNGGCERPLVLRRPTAVRSPSSNPCGGVVIPGGGPHYLKKSPSPTSAGSGVSRNADRRSGPPSKETTPSPNAGQGFADFGPEQGKKKECAEKERLDGGETPTLIKEEIDDSSEKGSAVVGGVGGVGGAVSPSADNNVSKLGQLFFKLKYKADKNALVVTVVKCRDLPVASSASGAGSSDPYVKLQLLPDKQHRVKTRVLRKTRNPVYDEDFTFYGIHCNQLPNITLHFVVLSFDRYSRDDIIGEVFCPLSSVDLVSSGTVQAAVTAGGDTNNANQQQARQLSLCRDIHPRNLKIRTQGRGEILVSLCWQPAANRLTVVVLKARNLPKMDVTGLADPYVKIYLVYNGQRIAKKKTHVKKRTLNPVFNESFVFDIPASHSPVGANPANGGNAPGSGQHGSQVSGALSALLSQQQGNATDQSDRNGGEGGGLLSCVSLEFLLLDWDRVTKNEVIGRLELGTGGKGTEAAGAALHHWNEVCNSPRRQIAEWHKLHE